MPPGVLAGARFTIAPQEDVSTVSGIGTVKMRHSLLMSLINLVLSALYLRIQAGIAPTLLEPNLLARTNILSHVPPVLLQGLKLIAVGTEPQRNTLPLAVRFRQRDWHMGTSIFSNHSQVGSL